MAKTREWLFNTFEGAPIRVTLIKNRIVSVNGGPETKLTTYKAPEGNFAEKVFDIPLGNGEIAKLCLSNKQILTYNGRDVETGQTYTAMVLPKWVYVFVTLYVVNFFAILGGALGGATSAIGAFLSARISSDENKSTGKRVILCILLYLGITAASLVLALVAASALKL